MIFPMIAKTFQGLEDVLAEELRNLGATNVEPGRRSVSFEGDLEMLYRANMCCRTALRILKPIARFDAHDPDELYDKVKQYDWSTLLSPERTFSIDTVAYSDEFTHSRFVTYRVKDAIVDWFKDRLGDNQRPRVCLKDADIMINVHIAADHVTLSLDSSGESLHKRGWRVAQTEAPINEVLAAGILLKSGWRGDSPLVDPMCGSGTFLIEGAMIAAGIMPGVYRRRFAFESWPDFDRALFENIYNDDSAERPVNHPIVGADINAQAIAVAEKNIRAAGLSRYITLERRGIEAWTEAPEPGVPGVVVTNPPYGERISVDDMEGLYAELGRKLKFVFQGYHAWIIGYHDEYFHKIGLAASFRMPLFNGSLECELREYIIFAGDKKEFKRAGGSLATKATRPERKPARAQSKGSKSAPKTYGKPKSGPKNSSKSDLKKGSKFSSKPISKPVSKPAERHTVPASESENPLAVRRNPDALKMVTGKKPQLPAASASRTGMRRRGWRPGDSSMADRPDTSDNS